MVPAGNIKKFIINCAKFILLVLVVEYAAGSLTGYLFFRQKTGKYARMTHVIQKDTSDIVIFGSSHAVRHFIPKVFEEETGKTCYNAGARGQRILFHYTLQKLLLERHTPEYIILNIDENWMYESEKEYGRIGDFNPYYGKNKEALHPILSLDDPLISYKLALKSYRFNSTLVHIGKYALQPQKDFQGFMPLKEGMSGPDDPKLKGIPNSAFVSSSDVIDTNFVNAYENFIINALAAGSKLAIVVSPELIFEEDFAEDKSFKMMKSIAAHHGVPVFDFSADDDFNGAYHLYADPNHMNRDGAALFNGKLIDALKESGVLE